MDFTFRWIRFSTAVLVALAVGCSGTPKSKAERERDAIFAAYGGPQFGRVEWMRFTFNVSTNDTLRASRAWSWVPADGRVTYRDMSPGGAGMRVTYNHNEVAGNARADSELVKVDRKFINDSFWLLYPLQAKWDRTVTVTYDGPQPLPFGEGSAHRLSVRHGSVGYTPGDVYRIYYGDDHLIKQWTFHPGGDPDNARSAVWSAPVQVGPLKISLDHRGPEGKFRLWFTDVEVKVRGSDTAYRAG